MTIMTKEDLQNLMEADQERVKGFPEPVRSLMIQRVRIQQEVLDNYKSEEVATNLCRDLIRTFKAGAGMLCPIDQARYCINVLHEILNEEKEK